MTVRLDHIQIAIPAGGDCAARAFWSGIVGLTEIDKPPALHDRGGCWFSLGETELHIGIEDPFTPAQKAHPGLRVTGIENLARALADAGHTVSWDGAIAGRKRFFTADPFGNRLEFLA